MPKEALYKDYNWEGRNINTDSCIRQCIYLSFSEEIDKIENPNYLFFDDINFQLSMNRRGEISDINLKTINKDKFFKLKRYSANGKKAMPLLEKLIDEGHVVLIKTITEKLPFLSYYNPNFSHSKTNSIPHLFKVVWHDERNLYYVDTHWNLRKGFYIPFEYNENVGVISKEEVNPAFNIKLDCYTISLDMEKLNEAQSQIPSTLKRMVENYYVKRPGFSYLKSKVTTQGRNSLVDLIEICNKEYLDTNVKLKNSDKTIHGLLFWKFNDLFGRVANMHNTLTTYFNNKGRNDVDEILENILALRNIINIFFNVLKKRYIKGEYILDKHISGYLIKMLDLEDRIFESLKKMEI